MIDNGTLVPCESPAIAAPIFAIPKKDNGVRWVSVSNTAQELEDLYIHPVDQQSKEFDGKPAAVDYQENIHYDNVGSDITGIKQGKFNINKEMVPTPNR